MKNFVRREYEYYLNAETSVIQRSITADVSNMYALIMAVLQIASEATVALFLVVALAMQDPVMTVVIAVLLVATLVVIKKIVKPIMNRTGKENQDYGASMFAWISQTVQGIKEIKILGRQKYFVDHYDDTNGKQGKITSLYTLSLASPAYIIEALFIFGFLTALCLGNNYSMDMVSILPELASFAIAAFRVLPSLGKISSSVNNILYSVSSVNATYQHVQDIAGDAVTGEEPGEDWEKAQFHGEISVNHISWHVSLPAIKSNPTIFACR